MIEKEALGGDLTAEEGKRESSGGERWGMSDKSEQAWQIDDFILFQIC